MSNNETMTTDSETVTVTYNRTGDGTRISMEGGPSVYENGRRLRNTGHKTRIERVYSAIEATFGQPGKDYTLPGWGTFLAEWEVDTDHLPVLEEIFKTA